MRAAAAAVLGLLLAGCADAPAAPDTRPVPVRDAAPPLPFDLALKQCVGTHFIANVDYDHAKALLPEGYEPLRGNLMARATITVLDCAQALGDEGDLGTFRIAWAQVFISQARGQEIPEGGYLVQLFAAQATAAVLEAQGIDAIGAELALADGSFHITADGTDYEGASTSPAPTAFTYERRYYQEVPGGTMAMDVGDSEFGVATMGITSAELRAGPFASLSGPGTLAGEGYSFSGSIDVTFSSLADGEV